MVFTKIAIHKDSLDSRIKLIKKEFSKQSRSVLKYIEKRTIENNLSRKRQEKLISCFRSFLKFINKDLSKVTRKDFENFKKNERGYSQSTLRDYVEIIRKFYEYKYPKKHKDYELEKWFKIKQVKTTPEYLKESEIIKLLKVCKTNEERFIVTVLFDSGCRIEEFLNLRFEDIMNPTESFPYYKIEIKEEYSKTEGRIIGLYWKNTTETIKEFLKGITEVNPRDQIINRSYDNLRFFLSRIGKKALNKRVHPHIFRKSSATYYANKDLGREKLCVRYGWKFSSNMPDIYIKRSGIQEEEIKEKILNNDLQQMEKENQETKTKMALQQDELRELRKKNSIQEKRYNMIVERLARLEGTEKDFVDDFLEVDIVK